MKKIINTEDVESLQLPSRTKEELKHYIQIMDNEWGEDRDYNVYGGYAALIENMEDYCDLKEIYLDVEQDIPEIVVLINEEEKEDYLLCVYIMNEDFNIVLVIPERCFQMNLLDRIDETIS